MKDIKIDNLKDRQTKRKSCFALVCLSFIFSYLHFIFVFFSAASENGFLFKWYQISSLSLGPMERVLYNQFMGNKSSVKFEPKYTHTHTSKNLTQSTPPKLKKIARSFTHSFTHQFSPIHLAHSPTQSFTYSITHSLIYLHTHPFLYSHIYSLMWHTHWLTHPLLTHCSLTRCSLTRCSPTHYSLIAHSHTANI